MTEYRIQKDDATPTLYWVERLAGDKWVKVFGTTEFTAGDAWANLQKRSERNVGN